MTALVYGAMNPDLVHFVDRIPQPGDDVRSSAWQLTWGGKAANAAVALAAWHIETRLLGLVVGRDPLGDALLAALGRGHLDRSWIERDADEPTRHCLILVTPDGERTIVCAGYAGARWQTVPDAAWQDTDVVLIDGFGGDAAAEVAATAERRSVPAVWLDAPDPLPAPIDLVVWSRHEHSEADAARIAASGPAVVLTAGAGAVRTWWNGTRFDVTPPVATVRNATGAGDVFAAACAFGLRNGWEPRRIVTWAVAAGAAAAAADRTTVPLRADIDELAGPFS
jgi:ribokinase